MKVIENTHLSKNSALTGVVYKGKAYTVQESKGWKYISVMLDGKRKLIGVSTIQKEETLLDSLNTVEGWQALYERSLHP